MGSDLKTKIMRDIKFRAWDKTDKIMWQPLIFNDLIVGNWDLESADNVSTLPQNYYLQFAHGDTVWMQFTGLKDKNGKEIYEGDILHSASWGSSRNPNRHHVVEWGGCAWKAVGYNGQMKVAPDLDVRSDFEVIGNIYESPELLK